MLSVLSVCPQGGGPCNHYTWCIGPHCTGTPSFPAHVGWNLFNMDITVQGHPPQKKRLNLKWIWLVGGTHPTGMHSCCWLCSCFRRWSCRQVCPVLRATCGYRASSTGAATVCLVASRSLSQVRQSSLSSRTFFFILGMLPTISNDRPFGCPIICADICSQCYFVHWHLRHTVRFIG